MIAANQAAALRRVRYMREETAVAATSRKPLNSFQRTAAARLQRQQEDLARARDPFERARVYLGRRGYAVYDRRRVHGGDARGFQVGRLVLPTAKAVMAYAADLGWGGAA